MPGQAKSPYLVTAPSADERCYELSVQLIGLKTNSRYRAHPWLRITANCQTDAITVAAGIRVERIEEEGDGA